MSEVEKPLKWYDDIGKVIRYTVWVLFGWLAISTLWGVLVACYGKDHPTWSPNLLGDSFGVVNAVLTAAAFIAVVLTYRKEQAQLTLLLEEKAARENEAKERDVMERKRILHENLKLVLDLHIEQRARAFEKVRGGTSHNWWAQGNYALLDGWCKLFLDSTEILTESERKSYKLLIFSFLDVVEHNALQGIGKGPLLGKILITNLFAVLGYKVSEPEQTE